MSTQETNLNVFINCPFDPEFQPLFEAIVFTVVACGYNPRCSLENGDVAMSRIEFIRSLIKESRLGIHDLSRDRASAAGEYARFNLPFELGLHLARRFYGAKRLREAMKLLVLEQEPYELQKALSDINGFDPKHHNNDHDRMITEVCVFLAADPIGPDVPGYRFVIDAKKRFDSALEHTICPQFGLDRENIPYPAYVVHAAEFCRNAF